MSLTGKITNLFADKAMTIPAFPRTKIKAVSDDNGVGLNILLDEKADKSALDSKSNVGHTHTASEVGALSNNGFSTHTTVLEAAMAMPKQGGSFFAVNGSTLFYAEDTAFQGREVTYLMFTDESSDALRKTVVAIPYGGGQSIKYRTIWTGAWQTDWNYIAFPADIGAQARHTPISITLYAGAWSNNQNTVGASGVTTGNTVVVSPHPSYHVAYAENGVYCSYQGDGALVFNCDSVPSTDIIVNVLILN